MILTANQFLLSQNQIPDPLFQLERAEAWISSSNSVQPKSKKMSLFLKATLSGWYPQFLKPVSDSITSDQNNMKVLDIATGPGTLPEMIHAKNNHISITGIDIDSSMIDEARERLKDENLSFLYQKADAPIEFQDNEFDVVTFCSVLFLLDDSTKSLLLNEGLRVMKPGGKLIVLTPSGQKSIFSAFSEVNSFPSSRYNWTFIVWKIATTHGGRGWQKRNWLKAFTEKGNLGYSSYSAFNNNATIEIVTKQPNLKN